MMRRSLTAYLPGRLVDLARPVGTRTEWIHVGAGQARDFASATPECPHLIGIDGESLHVVWRWRSMLRVRRGRDVTCAARHRAGRQRIFHAIPHVVPVETASRLHTNSITRDAAGGLA